MACILVESFSFSLLYVLEIQALAINFEQSVSALLTGLFNGYGEDNIGISESESPA